MEIKVVANENEVYIKEKLLGQGAFGKAYLVKHKETGELLVIKEMNIEHMSQKEKEETIKQAQILNSLHHPNIVNFKEVYITRNNKLKIVMEYAECGDLAKEIHLRKAKKNYFEEGHILDWFTQICLAIKHVHDRKILHRDIKGQNIFIAKNNSLKLGDFGIARVLNKTHEKARTVVGTPYYLSPEIIENKPYSFKSDIWSIGAVLYELCCLQPPFTATSLQMLALKIVKGSYTPIQGNYSKDLKSLIAEMLTLDPNRRPTIHQILQKTVVQDRIRKFLSETKRITEFSHTILHNQKVEIFANKLVQIQKEKESGKSKEKDSGRSKEANLQSERLKLKEDQARMEALMLKRKQSQRQKSENKKQEEIKKREEQARRREADKKKWLIYEQEKKEKMQREYEQNLRMAEMNKARKLEQEKEYRRNIEMDNFRREREEYDDKKRRDYEQEKKRNKLMEEEKKKQELNNFARQQYFENLEIRKRAEQRARREQQSYYSEPSREEEPKNFHYAQQRPATKQESRVSSIEKKQNNSDYYKRQSVEQEPTEQELVHAFVNPNYKKKTSQKQSSRPESKRTVETQNSAKRVNSSSNVQSQKNEQSKKKIEEDRQRMRRDREKYMKEKGGEKEKEKQADPPIKAGKWNKRRSSEKKSSKEREPSPESPKFKQPQSWQGEAQKQEPGFNTLIENSDNLFLEAKNPVEFKNYIGELQQILNDVHKRIGMLPQIPVSEEVMFREDDELEFSLTAEPGKLNQTTELDTEETDLDYFSNYSKLQTLRIQLEQAFGLDNFINLYRHIQKQVSQKGLQGFDILAASKEVGVEVNYQIIVKNGTLLLTLVALEDRMSSV